MLTSSVVWALLFVHLGAIWGLHVTIINMPQYMDRVIGLGILQVLIVSQKKYKING
jgi:hypothetical protein